MPVTGGKTDATTAATDHPAHHNALAMLATANEAAIAAHAAAHAELVDDRVAALIVAGANITLAYDDAAGTLTVASSGGGDTTAPVLSAVAVQSVTQTTASVTWTTNEAASSRIKWDTVSRVGADDVYAGNPVERDTAPRVTSHSYPLTGLPAGSTIYYRLRSADAAGNESGWSVERSFATLAAPVATTKYGTLPFENADDSGNYAALVAAGADTYVLSVKWQEIEAVKGVYTFGPLQTKLATMRTAGLNVVLGLHFHYPPAWVFTDAEMGDEAHWKNQYGDLRQYLSGGNFANDPQTAEQDNGGADQSANFFFSQKVRDKMALAVAATAAALTGTFVAIRPMACVYGEWSYPHTKPVTGRVNPNDYWAYDARAQGTASGRPASVAACPVPAWTPGTGTAAQAQSFADWYHDAIVDAQRWSFGLCQANFPNVPIALLYPSFGTRGTQYAEAVTARLDGTSTQAGEVRGGLHWARTVPQIVTNRGTGVPLAQIHLGSSWGDCQYSGTGASYAPDNDPLSYLVGLGKTNGFTKFYAESTGGATRTGATRFFERVRRHRLDFAFWAFTGQLFETGANATLDDLKDLITLDKAYPLVVADAATLHHQANVKRAQRQADAWVVQVLIGETGVRSDADMTEWNAVHESMYDLFDAHSDHAQGWAAWPVGGYNVSAYNNSSSGFAVNQTQPPSTVIEAHPSTTLYKRGVNVAGAEFGTADSAAPGTLGTDYAYPSAASLTYLAGRGITHVRIPFKAERLFTDRTGATFRTADQTALGTCIANAAAAGLKVILDMHNYARFKTGATVYVLGSTWTNAEHNACWTAISAWLLADATRDATVVAFSHNEPHDLGSTSGAFSPTTDDSFDSTVMGWGGGGGASVSWVAGKLRITRTMGGTVNSSETVVAERGNRGGASGTAFRAAVQRVDASGGTAFAKLQYQNVGFAAVDLGAGGIGVTSAGQTVLEGAGTIPADARNQFVQFTINNPVANATYTFDVDYWRQGSVSGGGSVHEAVFAAWVTAVRAADPNRWLWVPAAEYSGLWSLGINHPSGKFWTDTANKSGLEIHSYYDLFVGGSNNYSGTYSAAYTVARDVAGGYA